MRLLAIESGGLLALMLNDLSCTAGMLIELYEMDEDMDFDLDDLCPYVGRMIDLGFQKAKFVQELIAKNEVQYLHSRANEVLTYWDDLEKFMKEYTDKEKVLL